MNKLISFLLFFLLLSASCGESSKERKEAVDEKELRWQEMLKNFSLKHNALLGWTQRFEERAFSFDVFTVEMQYYLTQKIQNPIVVEAKIKDVFRNQGNYILELEDSSLLLSFYGEIYYELKCDVNLVNRLVKNSVGVYTRIAAAVKIDSVSKAVKLEIENLDAYDAYLGQKILVVQGTCIDFLLYPEN